LVVVKLDDLRLGHVGRDLLGGLHHQHRPDREVRRHEAPALSLHTKDFLPELLEVEAGTAHHRVDARVDRLDDVRRRGL
jgi:hypothetical protein